MGVNAVDSLAVEISHLGEIVELVLVYGLDCHNIGDHPSLLLFKTDRTAVLGFARSPRFWCGIRLNAQHLVFQKIF